MSALLSLLGLTTRGDEEDLAALRSAWAGVYDLDRGRAGFHAYCLLEVREPLTASTPRALGAAMAAARGSGGRARPW